MGRPVPELVGKAFGRLVVRARNGAVKGHSRWTCECSCGAIKDVLAVNLIHGRTKSCGCAKSEAISKGRATHGLRGVPEYAIWAGVRKRCLNPRAAGYGNYGGRGVTLDTRWLDFGVFYRDMGPRPSPKHSIERIDNGGPYAPENCRWATAAEQANNKRTTLFIERDGERLTISEWNRRTGLPMHVLRGRLRLGWPAERILAEPIQRGG